METQIPDIYIGDRLPRVQAAVACLNVGPKLRSAGRYCIIVGGFVALYFLAHGVPITPLAVLVYLFVLGFGVYLYRPDPAPWALPAAGSLILAVLVAGFYFDYLNWRRTRVVPHLDPVGVLIEVLLAGALFWNFFSYRRNLSNTDGETLAGIRQLALAVNKADLERETRIIELAHRNYLARLRRLDRFVLAVGRHYIAFGRYSKLDSVAIVKPEEVSLAVEGAPKPGRDLNLRFSAPGMKSLAVKLKPKHLSRVASLGIAATGLPSADLEAGGAG
jgi:hypothetical protein